jgi:hypothetical protein
MSQFDQSKWRKNQLLQEAGLLESVADQAAKAIDAAIASVEEIISYKDFALAVAEILKDQYGAHNFDKFMEVLHTELGMNESLNEEEDNYLVSLSKELTTKYPDLKFYPRDNRIDVVGYNSDMGDFADENRNTDFNGYYVFDIDDNDTGYTVRIVKKK